MRQYRFPYLFTHAAKQAASFEAGCVLVDESFVRMGVNLFQVFKHSILNSSCCMIKRVVPSFTQQISKASICIFIPILVLIASMQTVAIGQKASIAVSKDKIRLGDQFELKLQVQPTANSPLNIEKWFSVPDSFNHFLVVSRMKIDTADIGTTKTYKQILVLTCFDTGTFTIPAFPVWLSNHQQLLSQPLPITIVRVDVSQMKDYNDIKDIIDPPAEPDYFWWWVIGGCAILLLGVSFFISWWFLQRKKAAPSSKQARSINIPYPLQLDALQPLIDKKQYEAFFTQLAIICKQAIASELYIVGEAKTTTEYMPLLKAKLSNTQTIKQYYNLLQMADLVKFANSQPSKAECQQCLQDAKALLASFDSINAKTATHALN